MKSSANSSNKFLREESIGKLMASYAIPCIISLLVAALYNIIDQIFIANASYLGSYGNAANTVVFPLTVIPLSIAVMIGDGCCAFSGFSLGMGRKDRAEKSAANESSYYTEFAIKCFRIYLCMIVFACVNKACFIFIQAIGKTLMSTLLSLMREIVFGVGLVLLLPLFFGLDGVLYSMPVSDLLTFLIAIVLIIIIYRELAKR